jgi:two-component system phosphate regulon sensor histidine kinase PhoR
MGWLWFPLALLVLGAIGAAAWYRRLRRSLKTLAAAAEQIAAGQAGHKVFPPSGGALTGLTVAFNTMSEGLAARFARLEEDQQQLRAILSGMVEGVVALDARQRILFANERAAQLLEFGPGQVVGRRLWEVVRQRAVLELVARSLAVAEAQLQEFDWKGSTDKSLAVHVTPLPSSQSRGVVVVLHDISELRRLERLRQEFIANVSHELKTPLAVIVACVETLLDGAIDDLEHRGPFLEQIAEQTHRLHALVLDMLSLARLESGTEAFDFQPLPLAPLIAACLERQRARAEPRRQTLEAEPGLDGLTIWADEEAVSHILDNLVDNAVKYTPEGGRITVRGWAEADLVCLEVADTGIGIPERDLPRIFERFYRVDKARSREMGGTGLGLSIVKHLTQAMQGTIAAASQVGQGTTFTLRLPAAPPSP